MENKLVVAVAAGAVAAVLAGGIVLEGTTVGLTHSANPFNLKVRADFNKYAEKATDEVKGNDSFKAVLAFVKANGAGTLTATKEGEVWTYKYEPAAKKEVKAEDKKEVKKQDDAIKGFILLQSTLRYL